MKNNRKNRKLKFIRVKNGLRLGKIKFYCSEKTSNSFETNLDYFDRLVQTARKSLLKIYKLNLPYAQYHQDIIGDDFLRDLRTNVVTLSLK